MYRLILTLIITISFTLAHANESNWISGWAKEDAYQGVEIECRQHKSKINECRYTTITDIPIDPLLMVNIDASNLENWMENVISAEQFDAQHLFDYRVYMTYNFPGARNRDSVTRSIVTRNEADNLVRLSFRTEAHADKPKDLRFVRFKAMKGFWEFKKLENSKTLITYQVIALPGEYVEKFLFTVYNYSNKESGAKSIINLLKEARKPKYLNTKLDYSALENS
jgi:hypothetical protein